MNSTSRPISHRYILESNNLYKVSHPQRRIQPHTNHDYTNSSFFVSTLSISVQWQLIIEFVDHMKKCFARKVPVSEPLPALPSGVDSPLLSTASLNTPASAPASPALSSLQHVALANNMNRSNSSPALVEDANAAKDKLDATELPIVPEYVFIRYRYRCFNIDTVLPDEDSLSIYPILRVLTLPLSSDLSIYLLDLLSVLFSIAGD